MKFWDPSAPLTLILMLSLLGVSGMVRTLLPGGSRLGLPDSMVAGFIGLLLGPSLLGWLPIDQGVLETVVYHGLAFLFIAVSLRSPSGGRRPAEVTGFAFALPFLIVVQAVIGLGLVFAWSAVSDPLHPGVGLMIPLGFSQGPGQALTLGQAWEESGMKDGAQLGLIMAAMGFAACIGFGAPILALGRRLGWLTTPGEAGVVGAIEPPPVAVPGGMEPLTRQLVVIGGVYLAAFGLIRGVTSFMEAGSQAAATVYGFHFLIGALLAIAVRTVLARQAPDVLHGPLLSRISAVTVDIVTVSAIAAVQVSVIREWWLVVLVFSGLAGLATAGLSVWLAKRAFRSAPFEYMLVLFGAATGTLATGLALLRLVDPELKSDVSTGAVLGVAASLPLSIPLLLLLQVPASGWPDTHPTASIAALGILVVYGLGLVVLWRWRGGLRFVGSALSMWPSADGDAG